MTQMSDLSAVAARRSGHLYGERCLDVFEHFQSMVELGILQFRRSGLAET